MYVFGCLFGWFGLFFSNFLEEIQSKVSYEWYIWMIDYLQILNLVTERIKYFQDI